MQSGEKFVLVKRNTEEILSEIDLKKLLKEKKQPIVYCGYEPSGPVHLGHFVTMIKLIDFAKAGFKVKILLADVHAFLNRKGDEKQIAVEVMNWEKTIKAIGLHAEIILGSTFQFERKYQQDLMRLSQASTINRGLRSMQEVARDIKHATISQLLYPLMQTLDIKYLHVDVAEGGLEQRKVHMMGKDLAKVIDYSFIAVHTPLITSLKGPGEKMSKSVPGSGIAVTDSYEQIKKTVKNAYCPLKTAKDNPILQIARLIIFPRFEKLTFKRAEKFGGNITITSYPELEKLYVKGELHPVDLKQAVTEYLEKIVAPIRKKWTSS